MIAVSAAKLLNVPKGEEWREAAVLYLQTKGETFILQAGKDTNRMPKNLSLTLLNHKMLSEN